MRERFGTIESLGESYNPSLGARLIRRFSKAQLAENTDIPSLTEIESAFGHHAAVELLKIHVRDLFDYVECEQGSDDNRIREFSDLVLSRRYYLNIAEFIYFLSECKLARYGMFYGKTGTHQLARMLNDYLRARDTELERAESERRSKEVDSLTNGYDEYMASLIRRTADGDERAREVLMMHGKVFRENANKQAK